MSILYFGLQFSYYVCLPYLRCDSGTSMNHGCLGKIQNSRSISDPLNQDLQFHEIPWGFMRTLQSENMALGDCLIVRWVAS